MRVSIDKAGVYNYCIRGVDSHSGKAGFRIAQQIEAMIADGGLTNGSAIATEASLRSQLQTGHSTLRQAIRILESRYACRMRRGPGGGLFVSKPTRDEALIAIVNYLRSDGAELWELNEALIQLDWLALKALDTAANRVTHVTASTQLIHTPIGTSAIQSANRVLSFFATAIHTALRAGEPDSEVTTRNTNCASIQNADCNGKTITSAAKFADQLRAQIQQQSGLSATDIWLGTEEELCDRYVVSRAVLRQALCILEADGISMARRGRSGGVLARKPDPGRAIDIVAGYLSSDSSLHQDELAFSHALYEVTTKLACERWSALDDQRFLSLTAQGIPQFCGNATMSCFDIEWKAMRNRPLEFLMRALAAYNTRFLSNGFNASAAAMRQLHDSHLDRLRAIADRDAAAAGQIFARRMALFEQLNLMQV
ncbi:MAG: GntR family transcriptional regulator [Verrucomicrobiaceae bacterium]|nr:GntR family transcriptional regulator [Verrucomicrobiaceae bacterium]